MLKNSKLFLRKQKRNSANKKKMNMEIEALKAPTQDTLNEWLDTPRLARCGKYFTPSEPMWRPDRLAGSVNWQAAIACVPANWQRWLHAALAYRMAEVGQGTTANVTSLLSRAAQAGINPMNEDHLINLRERFSTTSFSKLVSFMVFWQECESIEQRPSLTLTNAYKDLPKKKQSKNDPVLSLDPQKGPFTQVEQNALHRWLNEQFCHKNLLPEQYLFIRLLMIYGQRRIQLRMMVFDDFIKCEQGYKIRIHWAKQRDEDYTGFRNKSETFSLNEELYKTVQAYKAIVLDRLKEEYQERADWDKAIKHVPLFRRRFKDNFSVVPNKIPVLVDTPDHKVLEGAPHPQFHIANQTLNHWLDNMQSMSSFPISTRTHQPLKISRIHRFRYTLGTDLSNAGLDEWSMAHALMHKHTGSVRKYRQISADLMGLIDKKMTDHLALVVRAFSGTIVQNRASAKNGNRIDRQIEDLAVCGSDTLCHLDVPFSCYACEKFQPLLEADHREALERMERRRAQTIGGDKITGVLWDRAIMACRKVIVDCKALQESTDRGGGAA